MYNFSLSRQICQVLFEYRAWMKTVKNLNPNDQSTIEYDMIVLTV